MVQTLYTTNLKRLSNCEMNVLKLLVEGQSNTEIADVLYFSPNTIKRHVKGIFKKFGVDNRVQAVVFALCHGLV